MLVIRRPIHFKLAVSAVLLRCSVGASVNEAKEEILCTLVKKSSELQLTRLFISTLLRQSICIPSPAAIQSAAFNQSINSGYYEMDRKTGKR